MSKSMTALSGRVMGLLGIPAAAADADAEPEALTPVDEPADQPGDEPEAAPATADEPVETDAADEALVKEAAAIATKQANLRWQTVLASAAAEGRSNLAVHLLAATDMAADSIVAALAASPKGAAAGKFAGQMADVPNPGVTASGGDAEPDAPSPQVGWDKAITAARGGVRK